jgi:2-iminobutanoate/2-iminopropanoate deaminase
VKDFPDAGLDAHWPPALVEATGLARPPFSPVVRASGETIYTSGQTYPILGSVEAKPARDATLEEQTLACLENVLTVVRAAGGDMTDIVKVTIYNLRMNEQRAVNEVYTRFFGDHRPTRTHVGVTVLADPDLLIEIEAIAVL